MITQQTDIKAFLSTVCDTDLILTVNRRLSNYLRQQYDNLQQEFGFKTWLTPQILPLTNWYEHLWEQTDNEKLILNDAQEVLIWENILAEQPLDYIVNLNVVALQLKETYALLQQWQIETQLIQKYARTETQQFLTWLTRFHQQCDDNDWLSRADLPQLVNTMLQASSNRLARNIVLVGFDSFSPVISTLVNILQLKHHVINWIPTIVLEQAKRVEFADAQQELIAMARWAYDELAKDKTAKLGCIFPQLAAIRTEVTHVFDEVFTTCQLRDDFSSPPYNISAAKKLSSYPIICSGLLILKIINGRLKVDDLSYLLRSPFISGSETELTQRAILDTQIRIHCEQVVHVNDIKTLLATIIKPSTSELCPIWTQNFSTFCAYIQQLPNAATYATWSKHFSRLLEIFGWPGQRILNSEEYQQVVRWQHLLHEFTSLDIVNSEIDLQTAFRHLDQLANRTQFQSKTEEAPIQLLGVLESAGIMFDSLWVQGLDSETWPPAPNPNPFIPIEIQHLYRMPHVSAEKEIAFSQAVITRFCHSTKHVIFSSATQQGDKPLSPSPLIHCFLTSNLELPEHLSRPELLYQSALLEDLIDEYGPPIPADSYIRGGTSLFKSQAICPFKAFAEIRLNAWGINHPHFGLALHERGSLLHLVLAKVWQQLKSHADLMNSADDQLNDLVSTCIDEVFNDFKRLKPITLQPRFLSIEKQRLKKIIMNWLAYEKRRVPFVVKNCELRLHTQIFGIEVKLQIDRIDELSTGECIIIDYKTGRPSFFDWFGDRPEEPQLPLYCISSEHSIAGVAFAQVRADEIKFKGITAVQEVLPDVTCIRNLRVPNAQMGSFAEWSQLIEQWNKILQKLAEEFRSGFAKVDPKDPVKSCTTCHLQELCRVDSTVNFK